MLGHKISTVSRLFLAFLIPASTYAAEVASSWFRQYQPIEDKTAAAFVESGVAYAKQLFGEPRLPVQKVHLRRSTPLDVASNIRRDFQLCEITDPKHGVFTIYLSRSPSEYAFDGQLAHEIAHLLNAQLFDMYVEGLNTVFAERLLKREGKDWTGWKTYLAGEDRFYGPTYAMMKQIWDWWATNR